MFSMRKFENKNNLSLAARIFSAVIVFLIALLCAVSVFVPAPQLHFEEYIPQNNDLIAKISHAQIVYTNSCEVSDKGDVTITGTDAHIVVPGYKKSVHAVKVNFKKASEIEFMATLYFDNGEEFNAVNSVSKLVKQGDSYVCFKLPESVNQNIRIDIDNNYTLSNIELHSEMPDKVETKLPVSAKRCICAVLIAVFVGVCFFFFDMYVLPISQRIANYYSKNYKGILTILLLLLLGVLLSVGIEYLLGRFVFGMSSMGTYFNLYRYFFVVCVVSTIILFNYHIINGNKNSERLFAFLVFFVGLSMILCSPFGHICWDFDSHSKFAFEHTSYGDGYMTIADQDIFYNKGLENPLTNAQNNLDNIESVNEKGNIVVSAYKDKMNLVSHIPIGVAFAVSRFLGSSYVTASMVGRTTNLIIYVLLSYFAMKKLKSGKMILATIAFFPTNIFLATNYSYDFWVTSFIFVGISYYICELQQPLKPITALDTVIMCGAFILACMPKQVYMPIMILPLFMFKKWKSISEKKRYYLTCILMFIFMLVMLILQSGKTFEGGGDSRGGSSVNPTGQVEFIFGEPLNYTIKLLKFINNYLSFGNMRSYIVHFAYAGIGSGAVIFIALLMFTTLTDKCELDKFKSLNTVRIVNIGLFFALICLVATSLYVAYTPVGCETIEGCQPRYIIPLLLPLLLVIASPGAFQKIKGKWYNTAILFVLSATVYYNVATVLLGKLM